MINLFLINLSLITISFLIFGNCLFAQIALQIHKDQFQIQNQSPYLLKDLHLLSIDLSHSIEAGFQKDRSPIWIELEAIDQLRPIQNLAQLSPNSIWSGVLKSNRTAFKMESKGDVYREIQMLQKKQSDFEQSQQKKFLIKASFDLKDWYTALKQLEAVELESNQLHWDFARLHLQTAGAIVLKNEISPYLSAQAHALKKITTEDIKTLFQLKDDLPLRLIAYATRYFDESLVDFQQLMNRFMPNSSPKDNVAIFQYYESLPTTTQAFKTTLELKGTKILLDLIKHEAWANALALDQPLVLWAMAKNEASFSESQILSAFDQRQNQHQMPIRQIIAMFRNQAFEALADRWIESFMNQPTKATSMTKEDFLLQQNQELVQAIQIAVFMREKGLDLPLSDLSRKLCVVFDQKIQDLLMQGHLLSAQAYLLLSANVCHGSLDNLQRMSEFFRKKAELALSEHDLSHAHVFYKSAWMIAGQTQDLYMLLEILAKISLIYATQNQAVEARYFLNEARSLFQNQVVPGPFFETAQKQFPKADFKAKIALIFIMIIIGYFSISRILKVIYDQ
jgi:hypothetical protein